LELEKKQNSKSNHQDSEPENDNRIKKVDKPDAANDDLTGDREEEIIVDGSNSIEASQEVTKNNGNKIIDRSTSPSDELESFKIGSTSKEPQIIDISGMRFRGLYEQRLVKFLQDTYKTNQQGMNDKGGKKNGR